MIVVPSSSKIYGIAEEPTLRRVPDNHNECPVICGGTTLMLQDKGMRAFQGFGNYIPKFGMSFEIDCHLLLKPHIKSKQEAITLFWGIYCWPFSRQNRYMQLESLEQVDTQGVLKRRKDIEVFLMKLSENTLASIIHYIHADEFSALVFAWDIEMGWGKSGKLLAAQALADGIKGAGEGHFRGVIKAGSSLSVR